jgi:hypothetical protein
MPYQSPIILNKSDLIYINQELTISGKNNGAVFDKKNKIFNIRDNIFLYKNHQKYKLIQYHFHVPSEHKLKNEKYPAEIHYVFIQLNNIDDNHNEESSHDEENDHYHEQDGHGHGNEESYDEQSGREGNHEESHEVSHEDGHGHEESYDHEEHGHGHYEESHEESHDEQGGREGNHEESHEESDDHEEDGHGHEESHHEESHEENHERNYEGNHEESHEGNHDDEKCLKYRRYRRRHSCERRHSYGSEDRYSCRSDSDSCGSDSMSDSYGSSYGIGYEYSDLCCSSIYGMYRDRGFSNILVIGKLIENYEYYINALHDSFIDLTKIQCTVPKKYFEYDGTLTTGTLDPVRWVIDDDVLQMDVKKLGRFAKTARELQLLDGRIVLFNNNRRENYIINP